MTAQEAIEQIQRDLKALSWESCGSTSKFSLTGTHHTGSGTQTPKDYGSELIEAEQLLIRCAIVMRQRMFCATEPGENSKGEVKAKVRKAILEDPNSPPRDLAYLYGVHEDTVRRFRREAKQDERQREELTRAPAETLRELATA